MEPSLICTLPGSCGLSSLLDEVWTLRGRCTHSPVGACGFRAPQLCTVPAITLIQIWPRYPPHFRRSAGRACGVVERSLELLLQGNSPKCPQGSFSFWEHPHAQSCGFLHRRSTCPLTHPTSPARLGLSRSVSHMAQLSTLPSRRPGVSVALPLRPYSPPCDFKQPGLSWCCSSLVWQGRESLARLSPRSPVAGLAGAGLGLQSPLSPHWSQGPFCPEAIPLPSVFLVSSILFGLLSS